MLKVDLSTCGWMIVGTAGLGCGANPDVGKIAGEESKAELLERVGDSHMVRPFVIHCDLPSA